MLKAKLLSAVVLSFGVLVATSPVAANGSSGPTCSDVLEIEVHGQHVIGDYVTGIGHDDLGWPATGRDIGDTVAANQGVVVRGGPGPGFHFENGVAPGASFCTDSRSPGAHF